MLNEAYELEMKIYLKFAPFNPVFANEVKAPYAMVF